MKRPIFIAIVFLTFANLFVWGLLGVEKAYAKRVYPGVWIHAQPLSGLTREQVIDRLEPIHKAMLLQKVTLNLADKQYHPTLAELGYRVDTEAIASKAVALGRGDGFKKSIQSLLDYRRSNAIPLIYSIDQGQFDSYLNTISQDVVKEPQNMALAYEENSIVITPAEEGIILDKESLRQAIQRQARPGQTAIITLDFKPTKPTIADESQVAKAKEQLVQLLSKPISIRAEEVALDLTPKQTYDLLYFETKDNQLKLAISDDALRTAVGQMAKKVDVKPIAKQVNALNQQVITEGQAGRQLNIPSSIAALKTYLTAESPEPTVNLKVDKIDPKVTTVSPEFLTGRYPGRYIEIDLSAQRIHLIEGDAYHQTFLISTGKWDTPTPRGEFKIKNQIETAWSKRYGLFMPNWMGLETANTNFYDGYGIHGLPYWPNGAREGESHLGRPVSHGCIRLGSEEIKYLYGWVQVGTPVVIHD